uniref:Shell matrix protein n=1 Tax=Laqueus rubellus TaxID=93892 RepID=A0A3G9CM05_LAQRU
MTHRLLLCVLLCGLCLVVCVTSTKVKRDSTPKKLETSTIQDNQKVQPGSPKSSNNDDNDDDDDDEDDDDVEDIDDNDRLLLDHIDDVDIDDDMKESQANFNALLDLHLELRADIRKVKQSLGFATGKKTGIKDVIDYLKDKYDDYDFDVNDNNDRLTLTITSDNGSPLPADLEKANDDIQQLIQQSNNILDKAENAKNAIERITNNEATIMRTLSTTNSGGSARQNIVSLKNAQAMVSRLQSNTQRFNSNIVDSVNTLVNGASNVYAIMWIYCLVFPVAASGLFR